MIYGEPERLAWTKDAEWQALHVNQLKVTQRSCHSSLSTRQSGAGWKGGAGKHRKQQMVGPRVAGMASLVITFSCSLGFSELVVWEKPEAGGQAAECDGCVCVRACVCCKARQRGSAQSHVLELCQSQRPALALPLLRGLRLQTQRAAPRPQKQGCPGSGATMRWHLPRVWNLLSPAAEECSLSIDWGLPRPAEEPPHCRVRFRKLSMAPSWRTRKDRGSGGCEPVGSCPFPNAISHEGMALLSFN